MSHPLRPRLLLAVLSLAAPLALLPARPASACINSMERITNESVMLLVEAEDNLTQGRPGAAMRGVLMRFPDLKDAPAPDRLTRRAQRVAATAIARMDGLLAVRGFDASTCEQRRANLEWAVKTLRAANDREKNSPVLLSELAEALSALPEHQDEARAVLSDLALRGVVPSPYAFRALARLRTLSGDETGARLALNEARRLARPAPPSDPSAWGFE